MIVTRINKDQYVPVKKIGATYQCMFGKEDIIEPVYKTNDDGTIYFNKEGKPVIVEYTQTSQCKVLLETYRKGVNIEDIKNSVNSFYNENTKWKIISGFVWNGMNVWLSSENQFNYKAAYDLAVQSEGKSLPVVFKFGTTDNPVYHTFETLEDITDFYSSAITYINKTLADGWKKKDSLDWSEYEALLNDSQQS